MVVHIFQSRDEYDELLKKPAVIIDAFAIWCEPCKMIAPYFVMLSDDVKNQGIHFTKFDIEEVLDVAAEHEITIMPTFLFLENGKVVERIEGMNLPKLDLATKKFAERVGAGITAADKPEVEKKALQAEDSAKLETDREDW